MNKFHTIYFDSHFFLLLFFLLFLALCTLLFFLSSSSSCLSFFRKLLRCNWYLFLIQFTLYNLNIFWNMLWICHFPELSVFLYWKYRKNTFYHELDCSHFDVIKIFFFRFFYCCFSNSLFHTKKWINVQFSFLLCVCVCACDNFLKQTVSWL